MVSNLAVHVWQQWMGALGTVALTLLLRSDLLWCVSTSLILEVSSSEDHAKLVAEITSADDSHGVSGRDSVSRLLCNVVRS